MPVASPDDGDPNWAACALRLRIVWIAPEFVAEVLETGNRLDGIVVESGLPPGARALRVVHGKQGFGVVVEHESFDPFDVLESWESCPVIQVTMRTERV